MAPSPPAERVEGATKIRRSVRYVHLNPCRARLVTDPLAWPFSTHLDAVGLTPCPVRDRVGDPAAFHRYVSADPTVDVQGTPLPVASSRSLGVEDVLAAVCHAYRVPPDRLLRRGPARRALVQNARALTDASVPAIAAAVGLGRSAAHAIPAAADPAVARLACDERQRVLGEQQLGRLLNPHRPFPPRPTDPGGQRWVVEACVGPGGVVQTRR
jgi:hypothetical protein